MAAGICILVIGIFYFAYFPVNYDFDGTVFGHFLRYALMKNDLTLVHQPQHPLYIPVNYVSYKWLKNLFGYSVLEYYHLQLFSFIFGLLTLWVCYKIVKRLTENRMFQWLGMGGIAGTYAFWYYTVEAEVHMPGIFFVTAGMYLLFFQPQDRGFRNDLTRMIFASLCLVLAAGFHLTNGLIAVSVLLIFIVEKRPFRKIALFFACYTFFFLAGLYAFYLLSRINLPAFYQNQLQGNDALAGYKISYWNHWTPAAVWESIQATANAILFPASSFWSIVNVILLLTAVSVIVYAVSRCVPADFRINATRFGLWMMPYFLFFTFWDHRNTEFKLNVILPFWILLISTLAVVSRGTKKRLVPLSVVLLVSFIGIFNFYAYMKPASQLENNANYLAAEAIRKVTPPESVIVIAGSGPGVSMYNKIYLPYFAMRQTLILDWMLGKGFSLARIRSRIEDEIAKGVPVYLFSDALPAGDALKHMLKNHRIDVSDYFEFIRQLNLNGRIPLRNNDYLLFREKVGKKLLVK
ncbi:MAG: hypothetical protein ACM3SY_01085 [Candidatus Omnitrophota bacterium]